MKIIRAKDYYDMSRKAANIISAQVIMKPNCVLGLATGGTPVGTYKQLVEWYNKGDLDFSEVTSVNLDEYRGLPKEHPESYWSFMHRNLFDLVNIRPEAINLPNGTNMDAEGECARYDAVIKSVGGVDLQLHAGHVVRGEWQRALHDEGVLAVRVVFHRDACLRRAEQRVDEETVVPVGPEQQSQHPLAGLDAHPGQIKDRGRVADDHLGQALCAQCGTNPVNTFHFHKFDSPFVCFPTYNR